MVSGKPLYFFKITVISLHFHCLSAVCICSVHGPRSAIQSLISSSDYHNPSDIILYLSLFWHKLKGVAGPKIIPSKVPNGATILSHITYLSTNVPHRGTDPLR